MNAGAERLREIKLLPSTGDGLLLYDLERTYLFEAPVELREALASWPPAISENATSRWLRENGLLTTLPVPQKQEAAGASLPQITDVSIDLPGACNMGCTYCFEKPIFSRLGRMSEATIGQTLDFAFAQSRGAPRLVLHFGSGEPVIEFARLRLLTEMALERGRANAQEVTFELTTNATLVTAEVAGFFADNPYNIRVSCDGPPAVHDKFRPMANGRDSYRLVERGLRHLLDALPDRLTVNSVFCTGTRLLDLWRWANEMGFRHYHAIKVGAESDGDETLAINDLNDFIADTRVIAEEIFASLVAGQRPIDYHPLAKTVRRMMLPQPITRFCGVAGSYVGVAANGAIYPCFRHLGLEDYRLGDVVNGISADRRQRYRQNEATEVDSRPICSQCWARYICGGGCYADSVVYGANKLEPQVEHCDFWRAEIAEGIALYSRLRSTDPGLCLAMFGDDIDSILVRADARLLQQVRTF